MTPLWSGGVALFGWSGGVALIGWPDGEAPLGRAGGGAFAGGGGPVSGWDGAPPGMSVRDRTMAPMRAASSNTDRASNGSTHVANTLAPISFAAPRPGVSGA
ncbi:hypothetical protein ACFQ0B_07660 [Nonomuraea thailandensis]